MIIYIHGYGSHGLGSKAQEFTRYFKEKNIPFIAPSLSYIPDLAIKTLEGLIESYDEVTLIGSSMGGYMSIYLATKYTLKAVLINPSIYPYETLKDTLGYAPSFYDLSSFEWNERHLSMLKEYEVSKPKQENFMLLVQKGDETLNFEEAVNKFLDAKVIVEEGGNHSFKGIDRHFDAIKIFLDVNNSTPNELYSIDEYKSNLAFALKAHGSQQTPTGLPYSFHILSVAGEIINAIGVSPISFKEVNTAIACALLHDVNEDTDTKVTLESKIAGDKELIVKGVAALTKDETLPSKKEQMQDSLDRLKLLPSCVQMVKLADRITNTAKPPLFWSRSKRQSYRDEAQMILDALGSSNRYLALKLESQIKNYEKYVNIEDDYLIFYGEFANLVLDKSHQKYSQTFKAISRLNDYLLKEYSVKLFKVDGREFDYANISKGEFPSVKKGSIDFIGEMLSMTMRNSDEFINKKYKEILSGEDAVVS